MPPGPKPLGERAMTPAEREARARAAHAADTAGTVKVRYRRPADRRSRPQRWRDAVAGMIASPMRSHLGEGRAEATALAVLRELIQGPSGQSTELERVISSQRRSLRRSMK